jgi:hypothetical protein
MYFEERGIRPEVCTVEAGVRVRTRTSHDWDRAVAVRQSLSQDAASEPLEIGRVVDPILCNVTCQQRGVARVLSAARSSSAPRRVGGTAVRVAAAEPKVGDGGRTILNVRAGRRPSTTKKPIRTGRGGPRSPGPARVR